MHLSLPLSINDAEGVNSNNGIYPLIYRLTHAMPRLPITCLTIMHYLCTILHIQAFYYFYFILFKEWKRKEKKRRGGVASGNRLWIYI